MKYIKIKISVLKILMEHILPPIYKKQYNSYENFQKKWNEAREELLIFKDLNEIKDISIYLKKHKIFNISKEFLQIFRSDKSHTGILSKMRFTKKINKMLSFKTPTENEFNEARQLAELFDFNKIQILPSKKSYLNQIKLIKSKLIKTSYLLTDIKNSSLLSLNSSLSLTIINDENKSFSGLCTLVSKKRDEQFRANITLNLGVKDNIMKTYLHELIHAVDYYLTFRLMKKEKEIKMETFSSLDKNVKIKDNNAYQKIKQILNFYLNNNVESNDDFNIVIKKDTELLEKIILTNFPENKNNQLFIEENAALFIDFLNYLTDLKSNGGDIKEVIDNLYENMRKKGRIHHLYKNYVFLQNYIVYYLDYYKNTFQKESSIQSLFIFLNEDTYIRERACSYIPKYDLLISNPTRFFKTSINSSMNDYFGCYSEMLAFSLAGNLTFLKLPEKNIQLIREILELYTGCSITNKCKKETLIKSLINEIHLKMYIFLNKIGRITKISYEENELED